MNEVIKMCRFDLVLLQDGMDVSEGCILKTARSTTAVVLVTARVREASRSFSIRVHFQRPEVKLQN